MILILVSLTMGYIGLNIGGMIGEGFVSIFGLVGFFSPSLYVVEQIYREIKKGTKSAT